MLMTARRSRHFQAIVARAFAVLLAASPNRHLIEQHSLRRQRVGSATRDKTTAYEVWRKIHSSGHAVLGFLSWPCLVVYLSTNITVKVGSPEHIGGGGNTCVV